MKKLSTITEDLKKKILDFLYCDEIYNSILIDLIENNTNDLGELYINERGQVITDILHIKNDGNSDLTNFSYTSNKGLEDIAYTIKNLNYKKILLAGKLKDVSRLLELLGYKKSIETNLFYKLNIEKYKNTPMKFQSNIRLAGFNNKDIEKVKEFTALFLEAETEEEFKSVTNTEKILSKMKSGVYLIEYKDTPIGMARFIGKTNRFAEITSVYIDEAYRNKGFGKELIAHMIEISLQENKTSILETSLSNIAAMKIYEAMGFEKQEEYAFEFIM